MPILDRRAELKKDLLSLSFLALLIGAIFFPALFQHRLLVPTDMFDTMTLPYAAHYSPPQAYNHNLTDGLMQSYPWKFEEQRALRSGHIAFWNPRILGGYPEYASSRQFFDVFNLLLIWIDLPLAFAVIICLQLFVAGCGMYLLLRIHRLTQGVSLLFAIAWTFNGMFLTHMLILWALPAFCWLPFVAALLLLYHRSNKSMYFLSASIFFGVAFLAATIQSALYLTVIVLFINFYYARYERIDRKKIFLKSSVALGLIAFSLSAIMWLPSIELFLQVLSAGKLYSPTHDSHYGILQRLISCVLLGGFFMPELLGIVRSLSVTTLAQVHPLDFSGYFGFVEMTMACWALVTIRHAPQKMVRGYAWLIALGIILPIFTPLYYILYHRFFIVATFGGCVLGAIQTDAFIHVPNNVLRGKKVLRTAEIAVTGLVVLLIVGNLFLFFKGPSYHNELVQWLMNRTDQIPFGGGNKQWLLSRIEGTFQNYSIASPTMFVPLLVIIGSLVILEWRVRRPNANANRLMHGLILLSSIQIVFWWRWWMPLMDQNKFPLYPKTPEIQYLLDHTNSDDRIYVHRILIPGEQYIFLDNFPSMYDLQSITAYESEVPRSFYPAVQHNAAVDSIRSNFLGLLGIKYLVTASHRWRDTNLTQVYSGAINIYQNNALHPRVRLVYNSKTFSNDQTVLDSLLHSNRFNNFALFTEVCPEVSGENSFDTVQKISESDNELHYEAFVKSDAYFLSSDLHYPGWKCYVDGTEKPIVRANYAMRSVFLKSGKHTLRFVFEPLIYEIGKWLSTISWAIVLCVLFFIRYRRKKDLD